MAEGNRGEEGAPSSGSAPRQRFKTWIIPVVPIIIVGVGLGTLIANLLSDTRADIRELHGDVASVGRSVASLETQAGTADLRLDRLYGHLDGIGKRLNGLGERLARVEGTLKIWAQSADASSVVTEATDDETPTAEQPAAPARGEVEWDGSAQLTSATTYPSEEVTVDVYVADTFEPEGALITGADEASADTDGGALLVATLVEAGPAPPAAVLNSDEVIRLAYAIVRETDSSLGNVRRRVTLEIDIDADVDPASATAIEIMMLAARIRHKDDSPDAVLGRLWRSYESGGDALNSIVYAPDGCGWDGTNCTGEVWTLARGELPTGAN